MKRLRGWLFKLTTAVSALLCAATLILWLINSRTAVSAGWTTDEWVVHAICEKNLIGLRFYEDSPQVPKRRLQAWTYASPDYIQGLWEELRVAGWHGIPRWGIAYREGQTPTAAEWASHLGLSRGGKPGWKYGGQRYHLIYLPHWLIVVLTLPLLAAWAIQFHRAKRRTRDGHCADCGYDLRASPDRCPECGASA